LILKDDFKYNLRIVLSFDVWTLWELIQKDFSKGFFRFQINYLLDVFSDSQLVDNFPLELLPSCCKYQMNTRYLWTSSLLKLIMGKNNFRDALSELTVF